MVESASRAPSMVLFACAALAPLGLLALGVIWGGIWPLAGLVYMTVLAAMLDQISGVFSGDAPKDAEFPAADGLLVGLALGALVLMPVAVWTISAGQLPVWGRLAFFAGAGLWFGQVANPAAHELIHRPGRAMFWLGALVYAMLLFGHHASAHRLVHHRYAASDADPNTARAGEGFYAFALRAWVGSFRAGLAAETALRARGSQTSTHPYWAYWAIALGSLGVGYLIGGWLGLMVWLALALHAQSQLLLSDYVQHYGLRRMPRDDGRLEPVSDRHSWNAPFWFSSALMLNAPRHSDHHAHPARPYPALRLPKPDMAPMLPWPLPVACLIALAPPLWRRRIRPHLRRWQNSATGKTLP